MTFMQWVVHNMATIGLVVFGLAAVFGVAWLAADNDVGEYDTNNSGTFDYHVRNAQGQWVNSRTGSPWVE
jgi:hypothetical protein